LYPAATIYVAAPAAGGRWQRLTVVASQLLYLIESEVLAGTIHLTKAMPEDAIEMPSHVSVE
jgi:hypothetical protein